MPEAKPVTAGQVALGFLAGIGLHLAVALVAWPLGYAIIKFVPGGERVIQPALFAVLGIGISQLLYMVPAIVYARRKGRPGIAIGIIIVASLTALLNAACFGYFFFGGLKF